MKKLTLLVLLTLWAGLILLGCRSEGHLIPARGFTDCAQLLVTVKAQDAWIADGPKYYDGDGFWGREGLDLPEGYSAYEDSTICVFG